MEFVNDLGTHASCGHAVYCQYSLATVCNMLTNFSERDHVSFSFCTESRILSRVLSTDFVLGVMLYVRVVHYFSVTIMRMLNEKCISHLVTLTFKYLILRITEAETVVSDGTFLNIFVWRGIYCSIFNTLVPVPNDRHKEIP
jgi:hypothetical protein